MGRANDRVRINRILSILKYKIHKGHRLGLCDKTSELFDEFPANQHRNRIATAVISHTVFVSSCFGKNPYYMDEYPTKFGKSYITTRERLLKTLSDNWVTISDSIIAMNNLLGYVTKPIDFSIFDGFKRFIDGKEKKLCLFFEYIRFLEQERGDKIEIMYFKYIFSILKLSLLLYGTSLNEKKMEDLDIFLNLIQCCYIEDFLFEIE